MEIEFDKQHFAFESNFFRYRNALKLKLIALGIPFFSIPSVTKVLY